MNQDKKDSVETVVVLTHNVEIRLIQVPGFGPKWIRRTTADGDRAQAETTTRELAEKCIADS